MGGTSRLSRSAAALVGAALVLVLSAAPARAADRVYWGNLGSAGSISFANLDGSGGGGDLSTSGASPSNVAGLAMFPTGGRIFWGSPGFTIGFANLDGTGGGGDLNTGGQPVSSAQGVAVDPFAGRVYWSNSFNDDGIYFASVSNTGVGGRLDTTGATLSSPIGVAVDPAAGRIYWANPTPTNKISFANLDGSGGGDINTTGATVDNPQGVALDPAAGRIYWANVYGQKISYANLDDSGGGDLDTTGATVSNPAGVSVDVAGGRIYWGNVIGGKVSFTSLDGSGGGGNLNTAGATVNGPDYPVILKAPSGAGAPAITAEKRKLRCSSAAWADDLVASFVYRSPSAVSYTWTQDGVAGPVDKGSGFIPLAAGLYRCAATATNPAGSASQTSDAFAYFKVGKARRNKKRGTAKLPITVPAPGTLRVTGRYARAATATATEAGTVRVRVRPKGRKRRKLEKRGRAKLLVSVAYTPAAFAPSAQPAKVRFRKR